MIRCHLLDGQFALREFDDFTPIAESINSHRRVLQEMPHEVIIELLVGLGRKIIRNPEINRLQGVSYISLWLRRENLGRICRLNFTDSRYLDSFLPVDNHLCMRAQPRGIVCHWIAANIPTLAFFSLAQAMLSKNGSIAKVPEENYPFIATLLEDLRTLTVSHNGVTYRGEDLVRTISLVSFEGRDHETSKRFSLIADCRIVYGGSVAIRSIQALPQKEHCETIVFGPKYSFGVFDRSYIESERFEKALENCVKDIAVFNQMACSSPQVLFFERSSRSIEEIGLKIGQYFDQLPLLLRHQNTDPAILANTINIRTQYLLSDDHDIVVPSDLSWTILIDHTTRLEDPIHGKCIFVKEVGSIDDILDLITRKIQAITLCVGDEEERRSYAEKATYRGVDRIVVPGAIHDYDQPWDGILSMNRLVRWVILKNEG
jgi:hypothetical protein